MRRLSKLVPVAALAALAGLVLPSTAFATVTVTVGAFGTRHTTASTTPNLVTQPIGAVDCDTAIPFTFTGLTTTTVTTTRYIQVWTASAASANCAASTSRTSTGTPPCSVVTTGVDLSYQTGGTSQMFAITPRQLFGTCDSGQKSFFFFDVASTAADLSTMFATGTFYEIDIAIDATAPAQPVLAGPAAGDTNITISWTATDVGIAPGVTAYWDPSGCQGEAGTGSTVLIPGSRAPATGSIFMHDASGSTPIPAADFGWSSGAYGQTGALAIIVTDSAGNPSVLSNVVCVTHVRVTGFWEQYCAEHGMTDIAQCTANYHGCSVGLPGRRTDLAAIAFVGLVLGVLSARRRRVR